MVKCCNCSSSLEKVVIDLGSAPLSNAYLTNDRLDSPETWFPLRVLVCEKCWLVQAEAYSQPAEIFSEEYAYFSSFSETWLQHARAFQKEITDDLNLGSGSFVVEIASNDGYLLQNFTQGGIPCLGIEPTASTAGAARAKGIPTLEVFFDSTVAQDIREQYGSANLVVANNVLAHVPDPLDFLRGVAYLLSDDGIASFEFPYILNLLALNQFDTIYHEHFSYLSLTAVHNLLERSGLELLRVQEIPTHGGSLRIHASPVKRNHARAEQSVQDMLDLERRAGLYSISTYMNLQESADRVKDDLLTFLIDAKRQGKTVVGYGAAAKGNTLLNFAGVKADLLPFVVDRNPNKIGKFLPGSRIPIVHEDRLMQERPDFILVLPWNIADEIERQLSYTRDWGTRFVRSIPKLEVR